MDARFRNRKILAGVAIGLIILIIVGFIIINNRIRDRFTGADGLAESANVLLLGMDDADENSNADLILIAKYDPASGEFEAISVPKNTLVPSEESEGEDGSKTLEQIFAEGGVESLRNALEVGLGIKVDYYASLDYSGFMSAVDALGGVEIDVDEPIRYRDVAGGIEIDISAGKQTMDGALALDYVRYKGIGEDSRIERQFKFMNAALNKALDVKNIGRLPKLVYELAGGIKTDIPIDTLAALAGAAKNLKVDDVRMIPLPGDYSPEMGGVWIPDMEAIKEI